MFINNFNKLILKIKIKIKKLFLYKKHLKNTGTLFPTTI